MLNNCRIIYIDTTNYKKTHEEVVAKIMMAIPPFGVWYEYNEINKQSNKLFLIYWSTGMPCKLICLPSINSKEFNVLKTCYGAYRTRMTRFLKALHEPYNYFPEQIKKIQQIQNDRDRNNTL